MKKVAEPARTTANVPSQDVGVRWPRGYVVMLVGTCGFFLAMAIWITVDLEPLGSLRGDRNYSFATVNQPTAVEGPISSPAASAVDGVTTTPFVAPRSRVCRHSCRVKVVWEGGGTVAGVVVSACHLPEAGLRSWTARITDQTGACTFDDLSPGRYCFRVRTAGIERIIDLRETTDLTLSLRGEAIIELLVADLDARTVPEATVLYAPFADAPGAVVGMTDSNGRAILRGLECGGSVWVEKAGVGRSLGLAVDGAIGTTRRKVTLSAPVVTVSGRVLAPDRRPLPGVICIARPEYSAALSASSDEFRRLPVVQYSRTDIDGEFRLDLAEKCNLFLSLWHDDYPTVDLRIDAASSESTGDIVFARGARLHGRATSAGTPAPRVKISIAGSERGEYLKAAVTDDSGAFVLDGIAAGVHTVTADGDAGSATSSLTFGGDGSVVEWSPALSRGIELEGVVALDEGITLDREALLVGLNYVEARPRGTTSFVTADGRFHFRNCREGPITLELHDRSGRIPIIASHHDPIVLPTATPVRLVVDSVVRGRRVAGTVRGVTDAFHSLGLRSAGKIRSVAVASDGRYRSGYLAPGNYVVSISRHDKIVGWIGPLTLPEGDGDLLLPEAAVELCRVRIRNTRHPSAVDVEIQRDGVRLSKLIGLAPRAERTVEIPPGSYALRVKRDGEWATESREVSGSIFDLDL